MRPKRSRYCFVLALSEALCFALPASAYAVRDEIGPDGTPAAVHGGAHSPAPVMLATQSLEARPRASAATRAGTAKSPAAIPVGGRGSKPVHTVLSTGQEQPGYVHYFLLTLPDGSLETLVGIELPGRKIAWSFPDLGAVVAPLITEGVVTAGGKQYGVSHLYGIRPFPDDAAMSELRRTLAVRVGRWVAPGTPYCENDGPRSGCMSCLGFVLRVLFPGRQSDFPELPGDFWRAMYEKSYSTEDLLLYLTGMLALPNREARLKRVGELGLPDALRGDVQDLIDAMEASGAVPPASAVAAQKPRAAQPARISTRPAQRKRL